MRRERSMVFWTGLILFCLAAVVLFGVFWTLSVSIHPGNRIYWLMQLVPIIVGGVVFIVVGAYMMAYHKGVSNRE